MYTRTWLATVDRLSGRLGLINHLIDRVVERVVPRMIVKACHGNAMKCFEQCTSVSCNTRFGLCLPSELCWGGYERTIQTEYMMRIYYRVANGPPCGAQYCEQCGYRQCAGPLEFGCC